MLFHTTSPKPLQGKAELTAAITAIVRHYFHSGTGLIRACLFVLCLLSAGITTITLVRSGSDAEASLLPHSINGNAIRMRVTRDQVIDTSVALSRFDSKALLSHIPPTTCPASAGSTGCPSPAQMPPATRMQASVYPLSWQESQSSDFILKEDVRAFFAIQNGLIGQVPPLPSLRQYDTTPRAFSYLPFEPATEPRFAPAPPSSSSFMATLPSATPAGKYCAIDLEQLGRNTLFRRFSIFQNRDLSFLRAVKYRPHVVQYAQKYHLPEELVLAIMRTESNFNPLAVSPMQAVGLMQIVPDTAGGEVHAYLMGIAGTPDRDTLFQPETNIQYGTTYIHLLASRYFQNILNSRSRELCIIAAYNSGPGAVQRVFGTSLQAAVERINTLPPDEVYTTLTTQLPKDENRRYIDLVLGHMRDFTVGSL